ncbi:hypothetical protein [Achromobacter anxifer]|uniref:hypothetical protein n=1 Tax=Achromobacter anxifer TaxID=1287737 RepID=UPI002157AB57|nr:hypothetical protein [Achromobacter anxifer]
MTDHTPAAQAAMQDVSAYLSNDEIRWASAEARKMTAPSDTTSPMDYVRAGAAAMLSKLRAPVGGEAVAWLVVCADGRIRTTYYEAADAMRSSSAAADGDTIVPMFDHAARQAGPVAGEVDQDEMERRGWVNIGYKHDLEKARRAISHCNIPGFETMSLDNAIYWLRARADDAVPQASEAQPVAWRYWNEKSKSWSTTTSAVVADAMRESGRAVESLFAAPQASEADDLIDALGQCRDAFPIPDKVGSKLDLLWQEAMSDPTAVSEYVKLCAALSAQPGAQKEGGSDAK